MIQQPPEQLSVDEQKARLAALVKAGKLTSEQAASIQFRPIPESVRARAEKLAREASSKLDGLCESLESWAALSSRSSLLKLADEFGLPRELVDQCERMGAPVSGPQFSPKLLLVWFDQNRSRLGVYAGRQEHGAAIHS